ncbi:LapA family protein [Altererythrobacter sp. SALINAS58]|uniref:LapA family protein n=1 Tax=Alteripontixanthobacter muriae TaxID=2705546 RepID=UPI0015759643|nr:LapA family protein [Alteripontixanthobacter muriae]NTZ43002.1 LapA family protein [Alteripontixanthobacter muriae]
MQVFRTIAWGLLLFGLLLFSFANWDQKVAVQIWSDLVVETNIPAIVIISFLLGFIPLWLFHRGVKWRLSRRIAHLENEMRPAATDDTVPVAAHDNAAPALDEPVVTDHETARDRYTPIAPNADTAPRPVRHDRDGLTVDQDEISARPRDSE